MLNIYFGDMEEVIFNPPMYFKNTYEKEWIENDFSIEMIKDVDKSAVIAGGVIDSPVFGLIPPERLSGGVKTLILINHVPDKVFNASACGDNCAKWLLEMGKTKDITIRLGYMMDFGEEPFDIHILNNDTYAHNMRELLEKGGTFLAGGHHEG